MLCEYDDYYDVSVLCIMMTIMTLVCYEYADYYDVSVLCSMMTITM